MKCVVAIDLPLLTAVDCASPDLAYWRLEKTTEILREVGAGKGFVLFRDALYEMLFRHSHLPELFWKEISNVNFESYRDDGNGTAYVGRHGCRRTDEGHLCGAGIGHEGGAGHSTG